MKYVSSILHSPSAPLIMSLQRHTPYAAGSVGYTLCTELGLKLNLLDGAVQNGNHQHGDDFDEHAAEGGNGHRHHDVRAAAL